MNVHTALETGIEKEIGIEKGIEKEREIGTDIGGMDQSETLVDRPGVSVSVRVGRRDRKPMKTEEMMPDLGDNIMVVMDANRQSYHINIDIIFPSFMCCVVFLLVHQVRKYGYMSKP